MSAPDQPTLPSFHKTQPDVELDQLLEQLHGYYLNQTDELANYSIFDAKEAVSTDMRNLVLDFLNSPMSSSTMLDRCLGSLLGLSIADTYGALLEFMPLDYERKIIKSFSHACFNDKSLLNNWQLKPGQFTDDTSMALCVADSLLVSDSIDLIDMNKRFLMYYCCGYNTPYSFDDEMKEKYSIGSGPTITDAIFGFVKSKGKDAFTKMGTQFSSGNGSVMRMCPVPILFHQDIDLAVEHARNQSLTTHMGEEAADCCMLMSYIIVHAINYNEGYNPDKPEFAKSFLDSLDMTYLIDKLKTKTVCHLCLSQVETDFPISKFSKTKADRNWDWKANSYEFSPTRVNIRSEYIGGYSVDAFCMALHCIYHTNTFEEAVLKLINLGGDADSMGAVCGQIAGAIYGVSSIPNVAKEAILKWDNNGEIALRAYYLYFKGLRNKQT